MKVTMKQTLSGTFDGTELPPAGETADVPSALGEWLVAIGQAETTTAPKPETTKPAEPEKATAPKPTTRKARG